MESKIHNGIKCNQCQIMPIVGIRYKCIKCDSYNLCEGCEEKFGLNHGHPLLKLRNTQQINMITKEKKLGNQMLKKPVLNNPNLSKPSFKYENIHSCYKTLNNNNFIIIPVKLINNGNVNWPLPCYLACQENLSQVKGEKVKIIKSSGEPGCEVNINIKIDLSNVNKNGIYVSAWRLYDEKGETFGPQILLKIHDMFVDKLKLKPCYLVKKLDIEILDCKPITTKELLARRVKK
jgi:hypothetical protein